jgi:ABC-type cobalamin/Fe3+-siderophores transport system ATPase subunit
MIKLKSILIQGFKDSNRRVEVHFSEEPVTVIYGANGSGKTTLLKIIHAIFSKNEDYLREENIKEIQLRYWDSEKPTTPIHILVGKKVDWSDNIKDLTIQTSVLFGVDRGFIQKNNNIDETSDWDTIGKKFNSLEEYEYYLALARYRHHQKKSNPKGIGYRVETDDDKYEAKHIEVNSISINEIEKSIIRQFRIGQRITSEKVKNAFFNTISNAVDIETENRNYNLPKDFDQRIAAKKEILISLIEQLDKSSLQLKLSNFLKKNAKMQDSKIFRALLVNILEKVEEDNIELKAINQLIEIFNNHLYRNKKLVVTEENAFIELDENSKHSLEKLSSGERHLLTFLTLFLIIGRTRSFFIIDEPEISLNMKWQRELMPLLSELCPQAQIIVATHSPSIAHKKSNYLAELI